MTRKAFGFSFFLFFSCTDLVEVPIEIYIWPEYTALEVPMRCLGLAIARSDACHWNICSYAYSLINTSYTNEQDCTEIG